MVKQLGRVKAFLVNHAEELGRHPQFFICLVLLNLPYVFQHAFELSRSETIYSVEYVRSVASAFFRTVFFAFLFDFLFRYIPSAKLRRGLQGIVLGLSGAVFLADVFALLTYHCAVDTGMLTVILATNPREAGEFLEKFLVGEFNIIGGMGAVCLLAGGYFLLRFVSGRKIILAVLIVVSLASSLKLSQYFFTYSSLARYGSMFADIAAEKQRYDEVTAQMGTKEIVLTRNESSIPYVIFVLGESTNKNHMSLYGYSLPTTPNLDVLKGTDGFYVFRDVISHHAQTSEVLEELFTFCRSQSTGYWFEYDNLFDIAKAAGIHTAWLSNQESFGIWGNTANHYADRCEYKQYTMIRDYGSERSAQYDEKLLPLFDKWLSEAAGKNFCVLHLMGTHYEYAYRYPKTFNVFTVEDEPGEDDGERSVRAKYDNAVRYNDFVVNEIIRRLEDKEAILIYISDHGENVYDDRDLPQGHDEINPNRYMVEIPMIMWLSPSFQKTHPDLAQRVAESVNRPFMTDDMIHVLLDIVGIATEDYDPAKSIINDKFDAGRERVYGDRDYDKETKGVNK